MIESFARRARLLGTACVLSCLGAAVFAVAPLRADAVVAPCQAGQLRGSEHGSSGAMGTIMLSITLRNVRGGCWMNGYTWLGLRDATGPIPTHVTHGGLAVLMTVPRRVVLSSGGSATVLVAYSDVPRGSEVCVHATALDVQPPGQLGRVTAPLTLPNAEVCDHGALRESPVLAGIVPAG